MPGESTLDEKRAKVRLELSDRYTALSAAADVLKLRPR